MCGQVEREKEALEAERAKLAALTDKVKEFATFTNQGATIANVRTRQRQRKLKELKTYAEKALWFAPIFGLMPSSIKFCSKDKPGDLVRIDFAERKAAKISLSQRKGDEGGESKFNKESNQDDGINDPDISAYYRILPNSCRYHALPPQEQDRVKQVLYLFDHFNGSDALYHGMAMVFDQLLRSYLVWAFRQKLNEEFDIKPVKADIQCAYMPLKPMIQADICHYMATLDIEDPEGQHFNVKVSGDGAKFSKTSNFC